MDKIYSISEIIEASNNILNISKKNLKTRNIVIKKNKILEETSSEVEKKILNDSYTENVNVKKNYEIDEETKKETLDKIYKFLKKKIRRNTLKIIFEQENEIETLKKKNNHLSESKIILKTSNTSIFYNLVKINQNNKNLNQENSSKEKILKKVKNIFSIK